MVKIHGSTAHAPHNSWPQEVTLGGSPILSGLAKALSGTGVERLTLNLSSVVALGPYHICLPSLKRLDIWLVKCLPAGHQHAFHHVSPSLAAEATGRIGSLFQRLPPALRWLAGTAADYAAVRVGLAPGLPIPHFGGEEEPEALPDEEAESEYDSLSGSDEGGESEYDSSSGPELSDVDE